MKPTMTLLLQLVLLAVSPSATAQPSLKVPYTYTIDYTEGYVRGATLVREWKGEAPKLFHGGASMRTLGPTFMAYIQTGGSQPTGTSDGPHSEDARGLADWREQVRLFNRNLHEAGVRWIIPYYCNQTIFGDPERRTGFWHLYDNWEVFKPLGLGPKPDRDPILWMQRDPCGRLCFNYEYNVLLMRKQTDSIRRYAPCLSDPDWIRYSEAEARIAASDGFDGLFIDNCIQHSYSPSAQDAFREWLGKRYSTEAQRDLLGFDSTSDVRLYHEGDIIQWAFTFKEWTAWLEAKYPTADRPLYFDTFGPLDATAVNAAGWGMLVGLAEEFIREKVFEGDPSITWEDLRMANPALATPEGNLRWAETKRFWADSVGEWLARVQKAGREINSDFFVVPNWGLMQRIIGAMGRAESGKDVARFRAGGEIETIFFEEGSDLGQAAPGVLSHYSIPFKLGFQNGFRVAMLAYDKGGPDSTALQHAEAAAFGGVCVLHKPHVHGPHHDIQRRYQRFFDEHEDWYQGYESAAQVGLLFLWEQVHFNNQAHLEAAYEIHEMLGRRQIPFDLVIEENLDRSRLSRYKVLVAPGVRYLSDSQLQVLLDYVEDGGRLILIMPFGDFDLAARPRHEFPDPFRFSQKDKADRANGGVLILESLSEALPDPGIPFEKALQAAQGGDLRNAFPSDKVGEAAFYLELDRRFGLKRHQSRNPVIEEIHKAFQGPASILDPEQGEDIRVALYRHPDRGDLVLHLINYRVPMQGRKRGRCLRPQENLVVTVSLPAHDQPPLVRTASPGGPDIEIQNVNLQGETLTFTLPILRDYALVRIPG